MHNKLKKIRITPSEVCDDNTFIRRTYLDIIGVLPAPEAVKTFVADKSPDKRSKLVDDLIARPEFVRMWVMKWAELLQIRPRIISSTTRTPCSTSSGYGNSLSRTSRWTRLTRNYSVPEGEPLAIPP